MSRPDRVKRTEAQEEQKAKLSKNRERYKAGEAKRKKK